MSGFVDVARINVKAGDGGDGAVSFHREKYVAAGGPDGGDGGKGGDVVFVADDNLSTLLDFRYRRSYEAKRGESGSKSNKSGRGGDDLVIRVPRGTVIRDADSEAVIADISFNEPVVVAGGGKGGFGNARFASPTRQAPRFAKAGMKGENLDILLELKLIADVGLVGFPNVGKSTLLSVVSRARPKIANYHFTTLTPMLGVVAAGDGSSFVMADIPGLIEGASSGIGLGHDFLRHIDRCRMLVHVVDVSGLEGRDPKEDFLAINEELRTFSEELASRTMIVAGNKIDVADESAERDFRQFAEERGYTYYPISAATVSGIDRLVAAIGSMLKDLPPVAVFEANYVKPLPEIGRSFNIETAEDGFMVDAPWLVRILQTTDVDDRESLEYFHRAITDSGIAARLTELGAKQDDTIHIGEYQFDYVE
ncbi:MAG: GTPase ObgE [Oscillospiraceae bacterium]|nr:GTPase ObgE [Oscillospiraceae bacterium]